MLSLGIIGTSWISSSFIEAAYLTKKYKLSAVYSRSLSNAVSFSEDYDDVEIFEDLPDFFNYEKLDIVYIASPNSLHFEQAKMALEAGKHVIVEKPATSNPDELCALIELSQEKNVALFEAARNIHEPAFETIKNFLADQTIVGADFTYSKYSSKMPALLAGELPNKFNAEFSGGLLADLGVYLLYAAVYWFGRPKAAKYDAVLLDSGVDISGTGLLDYGKFTVTTKCAGNINSYLPCEIYTEEGTLILDSVNAISSAVFVKFDGSKETIEIQPVKHNLFDEALHFAQILENPRCAASTLNYQVLQTYAKDVAKISYQMRQSAGIHFPADDK